MHPDFLTYYALVLAIPAVGIGGFLMWITLKDMRQENRKKARKKEKKRLKALAAS
jgi:hypothetical protein